MYGGFDEDLLAQWCELYDRFVIKDRHCLATTINKCSSEKLQRYLLSDQSGIATFLTETKNKISDDDYLIAYGYLLCLDRRLWNKPNWHLLNGFIEQSLNGSRYILTRIKEHPIARAIPEKHRFKFDDALGDKSALQLRHHWQEVDRSSQLEIRRSDVFNSFGSNQALVKIGLSPFAGIDDMNWQHDPTDERGNDARIPFWCDGAKDEAEQLKRLKQVLSAAHEQQVHILLFPELVMTETLQTEISNWLEKYNAFDPIIRLVIAGTRHVIDGNGRNAYSNRCTAFNPVGDIEWEQEKRQTFLLTADEAGKLFGIQAPAFEPTKQSQSLVMRHTDLGVIATPICLDFLCDPLWKDMPVDVFFVPAMSPNLKRFKDNCRMVGNERAAAAFICNAQTNDKQQSVLAYRPAKDDLDPTQQNLFLFTVEVDINVNYD
jgi:predicted amidohydrolase